MDNQFILAKYYELLESKIKQKENWIKSFHISLKNGFKDSASEKGKYINELDIEIKLIKEFIKDLENFIYNIFQNIEHKEIYEILKKRGKLDE